MNKYVLITGISSGIGFEICRHLISSGYNIIGTVRKEDDRLRLQDSFGDRLAVLNYDVTDYNAIERSTEKLKEILNGEKLYSLINNAGIVVAGPLKLISDSGFEKQLSVNLLAHRKITNTYLPFMYQNDKNQKSKIIFISSISGMFAAPFNGAYCISKHALECMIDVYRRELHVYNIDVVAIQPGPIKSKIWNKSKGSFEGFKNTVYGKYVEKADKIIEHTELNAQDPLKISQLVGKILQTKDPKTRYLVHKNGFAFKMLSYYIPDKIVDRLIWKNLNKADPKTYRPI